MRTDAPRAGTGRGSGGERGGTGTVPTYKVLPTLINTILARDERPIAHEDRPLTAPAIRTPRINPFLARRVQAAPAGKPVRTDLQAGRWGQGGGG